MAGTSLGAHTGEGLGQRASTLNSGSGRWRPRAEAQADRLRRKLDELD
ncbi:hypothetical protein [Promicromonospora umidemergens]|nr:hypothetical protein [Promicromonospora umidemergens]